MSSVQIGLNFWSSMDYLRGPEATGSIEVFWIVGQKHRHRVCPSVNGMREPMPIDARHTFVQHVTTSGFHE